jgi:hypothetical protein
MQHHCLFHSITAAVNFGRATAMTQRYPIIGAAIGMPRENMTKPTGRAATR